MKVLTLPVYKTKPDKDVWVIEKENGEFVNDWTWKFKHEAEAYLDRLVAMNYCKKEDGEL